MDAYSIAAALSNAFLAGEPEAAAVAARASAALGREWRWLKPVAARYVAWHQAAGPPDRKDVIRFLQDDPDFKRITGRHSQWFRIPPPVLQTNVPKIENLLALADWLCLSPGELEWFADLNQYLNRPRVASRLRHYCYRVVEKASGGIRLIEAPKSNLKAIQRRILSQILDLAPIHQSAHGFRKQRSIQTFVAPHTAKRIVLKMDLQDFFPSISRSRVQAVFRTLGYPSAVADMLGGLCTTTTPREVLPSADSRLLYSRPHLSQGAPTSPALANLCAYRLDCRLAGLAQAAGAEYTRYADDLAFSGDDRFDQSASRFSVHIMAVALEEGFQVNAHKTRIMRQSVRQHLAGLVTNQHANIKRSDFDQLKAILTNCLRHGPATQNRNAHPNFRAHLEGRISFIQSIHPERGAKLREIFQQIDWGTS